MRHVLIIDDDMDLREVVAALLESRGFRVTRAETAAQGLRVLARELPSVILLDYMLPGMSGLEFCRAQRQYHGESARNVPIVLFTASRNVVGLDEIAPAAVLLKPCSLADLMGTIERVCPPAGPMPGGGPPVGSDGSVARTRA